MPQDIHYSNGLVVKDAVIVIWEDNHAEKAGFFRAYWCSNPEGTTGSPVIGYCSPGGSHRTIKNVVREVLRFYPGETVYYNGKPVQL